MQLRLKQAVRPRSLVIAAAAINAAIETALGKDLWVTSGNDSVHMQGSKHYQDEALDFRTRNLSDQELKSLITVLKRRLGPNYQVILEARGRPNEHLHVEYEKVSRG